MRRRRPMRTLLLLLSALALAPAGCIKQPDVFAPPEQREPVVLDQDRPRLHYVPMGAAEAEDHLMADILPGLQDGQWRWTLQRPTLEVRVPTTRGLKFRAQLTVPEITMRQTGPVVIAVFIGGRKFTERRVAEPGEVIIEEPVEPEWLTTSRPIQIRFEIDKLWVAPGDGVKRGFILTGAGFVQ